MTTSRYIASAGFASLGLVAVVSNGGNNISEIVPGLWKTGDADMIFDAAIAALPVVGTAAMAAALPFVSTGLKVVCASVIVLGTTYNIQVTANRIGHVMGQPAQETHNQNGRIKRIDTRLAEIRSQLDRDRPIRDFECFGYKPNVHKPKHFPKCTGALGRIKTNEALVASLSQERRGLGEVKDTRKFTEQFLDWAIDGQTSKAMSFAIPLMAAGLLELITTASFLLSGGLLPARPKTAALPPLNSVQRARSPVVEVLGRIETADNRTLAREIGRSEAWTSKEVARLSQLGVVDSRRQGRHKMIALA